MRYYNNIISEFTNSLKENKRIQDSHDSIISSEARAYTKTENEEIDSMATKFYGNSGVGRAFIIRDQNVAALLDFDFDESKLYNFQIP